MRKVRLISLVFILVFYTHLGFSQGRTVDITVRVLSAHTGDSMNSPSTHKGLFSIINLGPDSIKPNDNYAMDVVFGNVRWKYQYKTFGAYLGVGDSILRAINLGLNFNLTNKNIPFCATIQSLISGSIIDSIKKETTTMLANNTNCVYVTHISFLGVESAKYDNNIAIYPNPSHGLINIKLRTYHPKQILIYNSFAQIIYDNSNPETMNVIDLSNYPNGVYFVKIATTEGISTSNFVLQ